MKKNTVRVMQPNKTAGYKRRQFIKLGGLTVVGTGLMIRCTKDDHASDMIENDDREPRQ